MDTISNKVEYVYDEYHKHPRLTDKPIVLYPAGAQGKKMLRFLRGRGIEPAAFCDASKDKIGTEIDGVLVETLDAVIGRYGKDSIKYIVNSKFHYAEIYATLSNAGISDENIISPEVRNYCDTGIIERPVKIDEETRKKLHDCMLDLMLFFHGVCEKYNIPYFLYGGTLIGALRHKGFIPWDDDVDIIMFRKDYNRFYRVVKKELGDKYIICYYVHRKGIALKNTVYRKFGARFYNEIAIDTFPADNVFPIPSKLSEWQEKAQVRFHKIARRLGWKNGGTIFSRPIGWIARGMAQGFANMYNFINTGYVCYLCGVLGWREKRTFKRELFNENDRVLLDFEGHKFYAPRRYDEILKQMYNGHYMELPPPHLRVSTHALAELVFDAADKGIKNIRESGEE